MSTELLPGIVEAVGEGRLDDALTLAEIVLDDLEPAPALIAMASLAGILHRQPNMSLRAVAAIMHGDDDAEVDVEEKRTGTVIDELLAIVEARAANGGADTAESEALLQRFDYYPGSSRLAATQVSMIVTLLGAVAEQYAYKAVVGETTFGREPEEITAAAVRFTRAVFTSEDPESLAAPISSAWG